MGHCQQCLTFCIFQDAGRPAKPREDPMDDYQEDQEQEIVRHQGSSSFPLWCDCYLGMLVGGSWVWLSFWETRCEHWLLCLLSELDLQNKPRAHIPYLPFSFSGVQSTLYALSPFLISFCINLQQLSCEMLTKQQLGWITSCASAARQDQYVFLQASPWFYSCGEKFSGSPIVCCCTGPTGSSLCLWKSWGELHLCFEKRHWVTPSKSNNSMGGRRMWCPTPEGSVGGGAFGPQ